MSLINILNVLLKDFLIALTGMSYIVHCVNMCNCRLTLVFLAVCVNTFLFLDFSFTWLCTNGQYIMDTINSDSLGCSFANNESVVTLNSNHLLENSSYFITVKISKDQRQAQYTQEVFISPGDPPEVQIRYKVFFYCFYV